MWQAGGLAFGLLVAGLTQDATPDFRVDVDLATVTFTVADRNGAPVENLRREELLLADVSLTQALFVPEHRQTILRFFRQVLGPRDRAFIVSVASDAVLVADTGPRSRTWSTG